MNLPRRILLSPSSDGSSPSSTSSRQIHTSVFIAAASAVFAAFFLALIYYSILRRRHRSGVTPTLSDDVTITPSRASRDHPFWHVKTVGLPGSAIESLGSHCHVSGGVADVASCSVCLAEVCDGEVVRVLPHCGHLFHVHCVDTWLRCHVSCPLCRAPVVVGPTVEEEEEEEGGSQTMVRVSVEVAESSGGGSLRSASMDSVAMRGFQEGEGSEKGKEKEEGSESERKLWFSRLGRTKSSSVLPL